MGIHLNQLDVSLDTIDELFVIGTVVSFIWFASIGLVFIEMKSRLTLAYILHTNQSGVSTALGRQTMVVVIEL